MAVELEDFVGAFESAQVREGQADLAGFLPEANHPLYTAIVAELIRVDMEYSWQRGRGKRLAELRSCFPRVAADPQLWPQIAFEEYRLRLQAGEHASPDEYRPSLGAVVDSWPDLAPSGASESADAAPADGAGAQLVVTRLLPVPSLEKAAQAYEDMQKTGKVDELNGWHEGSGDEAEPAELFREMHRKQPASAERLARALTTMPEVGEAFLNFRLVAELVRGAFGRVFLAQQSDLANRFVALKISTNLFNESQTLAQLQHTNIVPIYSAHESEPFQAVCMPYLGSTTLADVMLTFRDRSLPVSGKELVTTLNQRKNSTLAKRDSVLSGMMSSAGKVKAKDATVPPANPAEAPLLDKPVEQVALKQLEGFSYVQAVLWLGARLADGLAHAHEHGIIHRDLKPANVLLADDGQPLLLDFNISDNANLASPLGASAGGTLPYMAPEHLESFRKRRRVDARSDIYSLGLLLYELLGGKPAFPFYKGAVWEVVLVMIRDRSKLPPSVRTLNKAVSPALAAIVGHCLEPDPDRRYQSARDLQEDLERQLEDRPLRFAPEPSLCERLQKWTRRHPRLTSSTSVALIALTLIGTLAAGLVVREHRLARLQALENLSGFDGDVRNAQFLLYARDLDQEKLSEGIDQCRRALDRYQVLDNPNWRELSEVRNLPSEQRNRLQADIGESLLLASRATFQRAVYRPERPDQGALAMALDLSAAAEKCYDDGNVPAALWRHRGELLKSLGQDREARELVTKAESVPPRTPRDLYLAAHLYANQGKFRKALPLLDEAVQKDPEYFSAWFVKGYCHDELLHTGEAIACYSTCIALRPKFHWTWYNRGTAYLRHRDFQRALADFDQAIAMQTDVAKAHFNRASARDQLGQYTEAIADLTRALELGTPATQVCFMRAAVRDKARDPKGAERDRAEGMRLRPTDEASWVARGLACLPRDPKGALADFNQALELNPRSFSALQNLAHVFAEHLHDDREAVRVLDKVVAFYPECAMGKAGRGVSLARLGTRDKALTDAEDALLLDTRPPNLYQVACIYALTSRHNPKDRLRALELLSYGLKGGFGLDIVDSDTDLDPLRDTPEFRRVLQAARALQPAKSPSP